MKWIFHLTSQYWILVTMFRISFQSHINNVFLSLLYAITIIHFDSFFSSNPILNIFLLQFIHTLSSTANCKHAELMYEEFILDRSYGRNLFLLKTEETFSWLGSATVRITDWVAHEAVELLDLSINRYPSKSNSLYAPLHRTTCCVYMRHDFCNIVKTTLQLQNYIQYVIHTLASYEHIIFIQLRCNV